MTTEYAENRKVKSAYLLRKLGDSISQRNVYEIQFCFVLFSKQNIIFDLC